MGGKLSKMTSKRDEPVSKLPETPDQAMDVAEAALGKETANEVSTVTPEAPKKDVEGVVKNDKTQAPTPEAKPTAGSITDKLAATLAFDTNTIKAKYMVERNKRLRTDGNQQYKQFKGQFQHYLTDPYVARVERDPLDIEIDFLVLGAGFGGLSIAAELMKAGVKNIRILDKAGDFGGTWYWNRYPGAACDIGNTPCII
jgi:hypothetical protein